MRQQRVPAIDRTETCERARGVFRVAGLRVAALAPLFET